LKAALWEAPPESSAIEAMHFKIPHFSSAWLARKLSSKSAALTAHLLKKKPRESEASF
jgi:hypothetical protein